MMCLQILSVQNTFQRQDVGYKIQKGLYDPNQA